MLRNNRSVLTSNCSCSLLCTSICILIASIMCELLLCTVSHIYSTEMKERNLSDFVYIVIVILRRKWKLHELCLFVIVWFKREVFLNVILTHSYCGSSCQMKMLHFVEDLTPKLLAMENYEKINLIILITLCMYKNQSKEN
jgi:hypothetical protein